MRCSSSGCPRPARSSEPDAIGHPVLDLRRPGRGVIGRARRGFLLLPALAFAAACTGTTVAPTPEPSDRPPIVLPSEPGPGSSNALPTSATNGTGSPAASGAATAGPSGTAPSSPRPVDPASESTVMASLLQAEDLPDELAPEEARIRRDNSITGWTEHGGIRIVTRNWGGRGAISSLFDYRYQFLTADAAAAFLAVARDELSEAGAGLEEVTGDRLGDESVRFAGTITFGGIATANYNYLIRVGNIVAKVFIGGGSDLDQNTADEIAEKTPTRIRTALQGGIPPSPSVSAFPNPNEASILSHIPEELRPSCRSVEELYDTEVDTVRCQPSGGPMVDFTVFGNDLDLAAAFQGDEDAADPVPSQNGQCALGNYSSSYTINGEEAGRILCTTYFSSKTKRTHKVIEWTNEALRILAYSSSPSLSWDEMVDFWRFKAGPTPLSAREDWRGCRRPSRPQPEVPMRRLAALLPVLVLVACGGAGPTIRPAFSLALATASATPRTSAPAARTPTPSVASASASVAPPTAAPTPTPQRTPPPTPSPIVTAPPSATPVPSDSPEPSPSPSEDSTDHTSRALLVATLLAADELPTDLEPGQLEESETVNDPAFAANNGIRVVRIVWEGAGEGEINTLFDYRYQFPDEDDAATFIEDAKPFLSEAASGMVEGSVPEIGELAYLFTGEVEGFEHFNYNVLFRVGNVVSKIWVNVASTQDPDVPLGVALTAASKITRALGLGEFPNVDEAAILESVPDEIRASCHRADAIYRDEIDTVTCDGSTEHPPIDYSLFRTVAVMDGAFGRDLDREDPRPTEDGACADGDYTAAYSIDGEPGGRIMCVLSIDDTGREFKVIEWTNSNRRILSFMSSTTRTWDNLIEFWSDKAGPIN